MGRSGENLSYDYAHNAPLQFFPQFFIPQRARYAVMDTRFYKKQQLYRALVLILGAAVICGVVLNLFLYGSYSYYHHIADGWGLANCTVTRVNNDKQPSTYSVEYPSPEGHASFGVAPTHNKQAVLQVGETYSCYYNPSNGTMVEFAQFIDGDVSIYHNGLIWGTLIVGIGVFVFLLCMFLLYLMLEYYRHSDARRVRLGGLPAEHIVQQRFIDQHRTLHSKVDTSEVVANSQELDSMDEMARVWFLEYLAMLIETDDSSDQLSSLSSSHLLLQPDGIEPAVVVEEPPSPSPSSMSLVVIPPPRLSRKEQILGITRLHPPIYWRWNLIALIVLGVVAVTLIALSCALFRLIAVTESLSVVLILSMGSSLVAGLAAEFTLLMLFPIILWLPVFSVKPYLVITDKRVVGLTPNLRDQIICALGGPSLSKSFPQRMPYVLSSVRYFAPSGLEPGAGRDAGEGEGECGLLHGNWTADQSRIHFRGLSIPSVHSEGIAEWAAGITSGSSILLDKV